MTFISPILILGYQIILVSQNVYCKLVESEIKMKRYYGNLMVGEDNKLYYAPSSNGTFYEYGKSDYQNFQNQIYGGEVLEGTYNAKKGLMDYEYIEHYLNVENQKNIYYKAKKVFELELNPNENLEYIIDRTVKTNQRIYIYDKKITNKDECEKYEDISCVEELKFHSNTDFIYENDDSLLKYNFDKIKFYKVFQNSNYKDKTFVLTKDGQIYTNYYDY